MTSAPFTIDHGGVTLNGQLRLLSGSGPHPAVLVMHNALGIGPAVFAAAERLNALGYAAVVTDMYGGGIKPGDAQASAGAFDLISKSPETIRARAVAWFDAVAAHPAIDSRRIAAIGYCFGGRCALELARSGADVRIAISFHGLLTTHAPAATGVIKGDVIAYCGSNDPYAPLADVDALRDEMEAAAARYQITTFGGVEHGFTDLSADGMSRPGIKYDARADAVSWAGTLEALRHL